MQTIFYDVPLVPQPTDTTCWAASLNMVVSYRDKACYTVETVADRASMTTSGSYGWDEIVTAVDAWGLQQEGPASGLPDHWAGLLSDHGPLWVVEVGAPYHAVVLTGLEGDGTPEGTTAYVNNPWPPGAGEAQSLSFATFESNFELGAGAGTQIVYAAGSAASEPPASPDVSYTSTSDATPGFGEEAAGSSTDDAGSPTASTSSSADEPTSDSTGTLADASSSGTGDAGATWQEDGDREPGQLGSG